MAWFSGPGSPPRRHSPSRHASHRASHHSPSRYSSHRSSTSVYGRQPREGYVNRILYQIKRIVRDFYGYARRHPVKVFMLVVMPLITGGALTSVLRKFGLRLPVGVSRMMSGFDGGREGFGGRGESFGSFGGGGGIQNLMKIAKLFI